MTFVLVDTLMMRFWRSCVSAGLNVNIITATMLANTARRLLMTTWNRREIGLQSVSSPLILCFFYCYCIYYIH